MPSSTNGTNNGFTALDVNENTRKKWAEAPKEHVPPPVLDLTIENITENVNAVNSNVKDNPRLQYIMIKLVKAAHDFVRDVGLQFDEWETACEFLTKVRISALLRRS